jgi:hypothetical protein
MSGAMIRTGMALFRAGAFALLALWAALPVHAQDTPGSPEKPAEQPAEKPTEQPAEQPAGQPAGQPAEKPVKIEGSKPVDDGHDRPTSTPSIRIVPVEGAKAGGEAEKPNQTTHAYIVDAGAAMAETVTVAGKEYVRFDMLKSAMSGSLEGFSTRANKSFNIVALGHAQDFAAGKDPLPFNADNVKSAKEWLGKLECKGAGDLYAILKLVFDGGPDSVSLIVGSMPGKPAGVSDVELKKHETITAFVLAQVKLWRAAGKRTTLDITAIGLSADDQVFYRDLAKATAGSFSGIG